MLQATRMNQVQKWNDRGEQGGGQDQDRRGRRVEGAEGTLVGAAHLADAEDVQRGRVPGIHEEPLWSQRLHDDGLSGTRQVGHWIIPGNENDKKIHLFIHGSYTRSPFNLLK